MTIKQVCAWAAFNWYYNLIMLMSDVGDNAESGERRRCIDHLKTHETPLPRHPNRRKRNCHQILGSRMWHLETEHLHFGRVLPYSMKKRRHWRHRIPDRHFFLSTSIKFKKTVNNTYENHGENVIRDSHVVRTSDLVCTLYCTSDTVLYMFGFEKWPKKYADNNLALTWNK